MANDSTSDFGDVKMLKKMDDDGAHGDDVTGVREQPSSSDREKLSNKGRARRRRAIDFVRFEDSNAHGRAFRSSEVERKLREEPAFDSMSRHRGVKKEITEGFAALEQVRRVLRELRDRRRVVASDDDNGEGLVLVELCSGRGFVSIVLAEAFPRARLYMVDCDTTMDVSHVKTFGSDRMSFHALDLHTSECEAFIRNIVSAEPNQIVLLVGVHLCGLLSHRAIELFESINRIAALVVAPCCLPRRKNHSVFGFHCKDIARSVGNGVTPYQCWCTQLYFSLPMTSRRNMIQDCDMLSQKNTFLVAHRPLEPRVDAITLTSVPSRSIIPGRSPAKWRVNVLD